MRKLLHASLGLTTALLLGTTSWSAMADVDVEAFLDKDKEINIDEDILKDKALFIMVDSMIMPEGAAEAEAVVNAENEFVTNDTNGAEELGLDFDAVIVDSINANSGITHVNQDVGNFANQGNVVAFALTTGLSSAADAQAWVEQDNDDSTLVQVENDTGTETVDEPGKPPIVVVKFDETRVTSLTNSVIGNSGIVGVNQNAGDVVNQHNAVSLSVGINGTAALSESALGQENENNTLFEENFARSNTISASITGNNGITAVNQTSGNFINQASVVSFSALTSQVTIGAPNI